MRTKESMRKKESEKERKHVIEEERMNDKEKSEKSNGPRRNMWGISSRVKK